MVVVGQLQRILPQDTCNTIVYPNTSFSRKVTLYPTLKEKEFVKFAFIIQSAFLKPVFLTVPALIVVH
jgi:hypothetical protein